MRSGIFGCSQIYRWSFKWFLRILLDKRTIFGCFHFSQTMRLSKDGLTQSKRQIEHFSTINRDSDIRRKQTLPRQPQYGFNVNLKQALNYFESSKVNKTTRANHMHKKITTQQLPGGRSADFLELQGKVSQFHSQDSNGKVSFGFNSPSQARFEERDNDGSVRGSYSYFDTNGKKVEVNYWDNGEGFHVQGNHFPTVNDLPQITQFTPEVQAARDLHFKIYDEILSSSNRFLNTFNVENNQKDAPIAVQVKNFQSMPPQSFKHDQTNYQVRRTDFGGHVKVNTDPTENINYVQYEWYTNSPKTTINTKLNQNKTSLKYQQAIIIPNVIYKENNQADYEIHDLKSDSSKETKIDDRNDLNKEIRIQDAKTDRIKEFKIKDVKSDLIKEVKNQDVKNNLNKEVGDDQNKEIKFHVVENSFNKEMNHSIENSFQRNVENEILNLNKEKTQLENSNKNVKTSNDSIATENERIYDLSNAFSDISNTQKLDLSNNRKVNNILHANEWIDNYDKINNKTISKIYNLTKESAMKNNVAGDTLKNDDNNETRLVNSRSNNSFYYHFQHPTTTLLNDKLARSNFLSELIGVSSKRLHVSSNRKANSRPYYFYPIVYP